MRANFKRNLKTRAKCLRSFKERPASSRHSISPTTDICRKLHRFVHNLSGTALEGRSQHCVPRQKWRVSVYLERLFLRQKRWEKTMHIVIKVKIDKHNWNKSSSPTLLIEGFVSSTKVQRTARFK